MEQKRKRIMTETRNIVLTSFEYCTTFWKRNKGICFKKSFMPHIFVNDSQYHTSIFHSFFCKSFYIICLNDFSEVTETRLITPNQFFCVQARTIIEIMPQDFFHLQIQLKDKIILSI